MYTRDMTTTHHQMEPAMDPKEYARLYNAGWRAAENGSALGDSPRADAWMDGYVDSSMPLPKWHSRDCSETHGHDGCGRAAWAAVR